MILPSATKLCFKPVCHSVHRGDLPQCMLGYHPAMGADSPSDQAPPDQTRHTPLGADSPKTRHPRTKHPLGADTPPGADPPGADPPADQAPPPPQTAASYWNAFLFVECKHILKLPPHENDLNSCSRHREKGIQLIINISLCKNYTKVTRGDAVDEVDAVDAVE